MITNPWKKTAVLFVMLTTMLLILTAFAISALADQTDQGQLPPPPPPPHVQGVAQGDYLYVLDFRSIYQYSSSDMRLTRTVTLPEPQLPSLPSTNDGRPPMPPRLTLLTSTSGGEVYLNVLDFRSIHWYKLPTLEFVQTVTLPDPS